MTHMTHKNPQALPPVPFHVGHVSKKSDPHLTHMTHIITLQFVGYAKLYLTMTI